MIMKDEIINLCIKSNVWISAINWGKKKYKYLIVFVWNHIPKRYTWFKFVLLVYVNKVSELFYFFILFYMLLDLLTLMYMYQDTTKENALKQCWNLAKKNKFGPFILTLPIIENY